MNFYLYLLVMAGTTYLVRMLPFTLFQRKIKSIFIKSFLNYVPYAVLAAMTVPAMFTATGDWRSSLAGFITAAILAFRRKSLIVVAVAACLAAYIVSLLIQYVF